MRSVEQLAVVIRLAALTEDRSRSEQAALEAVAARCDKERNQLSISNPRLTNWLLTEVSVAHTELWPPCTFSTDHDKGCKCHNLANGRPGFLPTPPGGWSRLVWEVTDSWPERPQRIQRRRARGWRLPEGAVIVDRTSVFGNPFTLGMAYSRGAASEDEARNWAVNRYADWVSSTPSDPELHDYWMRLRRRLGELPGRDLACTCPLDGMACHGDWLIDFVNP